MILHSVNRLYVAVFLSPESEQKNRVNLKRKFKKFRADTEAPSQDNLPHEPLTTTRSLSEVSWLETHPQEQQGFIRQFQTEPWRFPFFLILQS